MHFRMLVTISMDDDATEANACETVYETLLHDDSFVGEGGLFGSPLCDWFVIGGRWTGLLTEAVIRDAFREAVVARFPAMATPWRAESTVPDHQAILDEIWRELGGIGPSPCSRDTLKRYPDDAAIITPAIYETLLAPYEGKVSFHANGGCEFIDLDDEPLGRTAIGTKWVVVIDYHS